MLTDVVQFVLILTSFVGVEGLDLSAAGLSANYDWVTVGGKDQSHAYSREKDHRWAGLGDVVADADIKIDLQREGTESFGGTEDHEGSSEFPEGTAEG